jgi:hypothetical protein
MYSLISALNGHEWSASRPAALPPRKEPRYPLDRRLEGPQRRSGHDVEEEISQPTRGIEPRSDRPARSQSLYRLSSRYKTEQWEVSYKMDLGETEQ